MRRPTLLVTISLLALACAEPEPTRAGEQTAAREQAPKQPEPDLSQPVAGVAEVVEPTSPVGEPVIEAEPSEVSEEAVEPSEAEPVEPPPADPLAPILPSGPEPGSPESDAELAELLEESTLTQEEFDAAFRGSKPKIEGDKFVFGPNDRTRKRPVVVIGSKPKITSSKVAASELVALAKADLRKLEGCLAVALVDDPTLDGSATLSLGFDADGEVSEAGVTGAVGATLRACLATVAEGWSLPAAAGARVEMTLTLRGE